MTRRTSAVILSWMCVSAAAFAQQAPAPTAATTQPGSKPPPRTLTLDQAVQLALGNSKALRAAAEGVNRARGVVNERRAAQQPGVNLDATFTRLDEGASFEFPGENGEVQTVPIIKQNQRSFGLNASLPIDIFGSLRNARKASEFQEIGARLEFNRSRNQVVLDTKNAFYEVLRSRAFLNVSDQALKNAQDRERITQTYLTAGTGTRFDVLRAQTDVANAQQSVISARNRVNLATANLNNVVGLDQNTPTEVVEVREQPVVETTFDTAVAEAYDTRPEILQAEAQIAAAEKGLDVYSAFTTPPTVSWGYNYQPDQGGFAPRTTSWAAMATVRIPLYEGGARKARQQQGRADVESAKLSRRSQMDLVALEVRQAYLAVTEAQERMNVSQAALKQAEEQYRLAQLRFREGVTLVPGASPLLEISDAQTALTQAQVNDVNNLFDLQNATARLDRAIGRYAFDGTARPGLPRPEHIKK